MAAFNTIITDIPPLNVQRPNGYIVVPTKQSDGASRFFRAEMYNGTEPWNPGEDSGIIKTIRYRKPNGHAGEYDTAEDGQPAVVVDPINNTVTFAMREQALDVPGKVLVDLSFYQTVAGASYVRRISTFNIILDVEGQPISDQALIESGDSYVSVMGNVFENAEKLATALTGMTASANKNYKTPIDEGGFADVQVNGGPEEDAPYEFVFQIPAGKRGSRGDGIKSLEEVNVSHIPGELDAYRFVTDDGDRTALFYVRNGNNGADGKGSVTSVDGVTSVSGNVPLNALRVPQGNDAVQALTTTQIAKIRKALGIGSMASYDYVFPDGNGGYTGFTDNALIFGDVSQSQYNELVSNVQTLTNRVAQVEVKKEESIRTANWLVDYGYSTDEELAITSTSASSVASFGVKRERMRFIFNKAAAMNMRVYIKLTNTLARSTSTSGTTGISGWSDGFTTTVGHTYRAIVRMLSGSFSGVSVKPTFALYWLGDSTNKLTKQAWVSDDICMMDYIAAETKVVNLAAVIQANTTFADWSFELMIMDITNNGSVSNRVITNNLESSMVASANYSAGDYILAGQRLFKATTAISFGSSLSVGSNVTETTLIEELQALAARINS